MDNTFIVVPTYPGGDCTRKQGHFSNVHFHDSYDMRWDSHSK